VPGQRLDHQGKAPDSPGHRGQRTLEKTTIEHDNSRNKKSHRDPSSNDGYLHPAIIRICDRAATSSETLVDAGLQK
jgi:hypothetical protein